MTKILGTQPHSFEVNDIVVVVSRSYANDPRYRGKFFRVHATSYSLVTIMPLHQPAKLIGYSSFHYSHLRPASALEMLAHYDVDL